MPREGKGQDARFRLATGSVAEAFQVLPNNYTIKKKKKLTFSPCPPPHPPPTPLHTHIHTADRDFTGAFQLPLDPSDVICSISLMGTDALGN